MMACLLRPSSVSMSTSMEITFDHSFCIRLLLLGSQGVPPHWRHPQIPWIAGTGTRNLDPFSASSFDHNFQPNDNQAFIVYMKSTLVLYRKGLCVFSGFGIRPGRKVMKKSVVSIMDQREYIWERQHNR